MTRLTFLRWLRRFAELMDIPRSKVSREAAFLHWVRGDDPADAFKQWARWGR